jgi:hypothetical protein
MLTWIRTKIWKRRRLIFRFHDGRRIRAIDPVEVAIALHSHPVFLYRHLSEAADGDFEAQRIVAQTACDVFGVSSVAEDEHYGLTVAERIELVMSFDLYLMELKKNTAVSLTSAPSTVST